MDGRANPLSDRRVVGGSASVLVVVVLICFNCSCDALVVGVVVVVQ